MVVVVLLLLLASWLGRLQFWVLLVQQDVCSLQPAAV
jgi:hypothetical protein